VVFVTFAANWANILAEYAGISAVADIYGLPRFVVVPVSALLIWIVVWKGSFRVVQKIFLTSSVLFLAYVIAGALAHPDWSGVWQGISKPTVEFNPGFFYVAVAMIGTTITAWGQFFVQSYYVDKGVAAEHLKYSRYDVLAGTLWTSIVAFFIILATAATLNKAGIVITDAGQAAAALQPFAGDFAKHLFAWGLFNASMLGLAVVSMTSSYLVTEAFGWEGRVDLKKESPVYYGLFTFCVFSAALAILIPGLPLVSIIVGSQMLNTFVLPILFLAILRLLNSRKLMGKFRNGIFSNIVSWVSVAFIVGMSGLLLVLTFSQH
jgi:Mn2+/Fe2+ NRAMP family transporter